MISYLNPSPFQLNASSHTDSQIYVTVIATDTQMGKYIKRIYFFDVGNSMIRVREMSQVL